ALLVLEGLEARAGGTGVDVLLQTLAFLSREPPIEEPRYVLLRPGARDEVVELLGQRAPGPEEERLEGAGGDPEHLRDLGVRPAFDLAHHDRLALRHGDATEGSHQLGDGRSVAVLLNARRLREVALEQGLSGSRALLPETLAHEVVRDREQP